MSTTYRYRIMGRFLDDTTDRIYGMCPLKADEEESRLLLRQVQSDAEEYGRWRDLRLERSATGEWEPVA